MSLYNKLTEARENNDVEAYWACFHLDWEMTWHSTGKVANLNSMRAEQLKAIMENADIKNRRCIYENDDILAQHLRADYPNGTKDATMHVSLKETGSYIDLKRALHPFKANRRPQTKSAFHNFKSRQKGLTASFFGENGAAFLINK